MMKFDEKYDSEAFLLFLREFLPEDFVGKEEDIITNKNRYKIITNAKILGYCESLDLYVLEMDHDRENDPRVAITADAFKILADHWIHRALVIFKNNDSDNYRFSYLTIKLDLNDKNKAVKKYSNARRYSFYLGANAKVRTPEQLLIKRGKIQNIDDLLNRFSVEVVSKEFYTRIATQYSKLVGGTRGEGKTAINFERTLVLGNKDDAVNANFAIRLIGRLVFCWFLKQKRGNNPLIPSEILSVSAVKTIGDYYHSICAPLFFEVLNKPQSSRPKFFYYSEYFDKVPFLNGGLFQDHPEDNHKFNRTSGLSERRGVVDIPDIWFLELFEIFEEYNFTIDENTLIDTELSIDPEMLGRIFENLLAEVNPETGDSARKSTGSFYTPREIVDYMVEESLISYLKRRTNISEEKLRALSSYDLDDDMKHPVDQQESKLLVEAIHNTTVLDPACGSGAFPIGVLQRLVHMLEVLDPECLIYLNKLPPEVRRQLQKHSLNYVRKLGVIRECIYGVDIQPIAIDISRLRCFLTLVVDQRVDDSASNRGIEPLPNLDFKFVCANTLIKPPVHEGPLFGDEFADELGELIDEYFAPVDQLNKLETAQRLQQLISDKTKKELEGIINDRGLFDDPKLVKHYKDNRANNDSERIRLINLWDSYKNIFQNKPVGFFDTRYFFPIVFRNGGFDIVIGNPPYGATLSSDEKRFYRRNYVTAKTVKGIQKGSIDTYTLFIELGHSLLCHNGNLAYIVPMSITSSDSVEGVHKLLDKTCKTIKVASFSNRPTQIFQNAGLRVSILFFDKTNSSCESLLTTKLLRKRAQESIQDVLDAMKYINSKNFMLIGRYPKISEAIELSILQKLFSQKQRVRDFLRESGSPVYYRTSGGRYFNVITNYETGSTKERALYLSKQMQNVIGIALSSSLFWFYQQVYSNGIDLKTYELENFAIPPLLPDMLPKIDDLYSLYLSEIERNSITHLTNQENSYTVKSFKEYKIQKSKSLIDRIDDLVCPLYGLNEEEIVYIKNYELDYRLSNKD